MPPLMMPPPMPPPMLPPPLPPSLLPLPLSGYALAAQMHAPYAGGAYYAEDRYYVHEAPRDPYRAHAAPQHRAADWSRSPPRTRRMTPEEYAAQYYGDGAGPSAGYDEVAAIVNSTRALAAMRAMHQADRYRQQYFAPPSLLYDDRAAYATDAPYAHRAAYPGADHDLRAAYPVADLRAAYAVVADRQNEHRSHEEVAGEQSCSGLPAKYNGPPPPAAARALQPRNTAADHHAPAGLEPWRYH
ncbi:hypothetical protein M885DRAFT_504861 [Pelagophyceae sp. CCMP2097]|nr:hypothetical protein M885DRAFT_504861 [Pelagophyceae sp. CCMP2097]